jgi:hypothetical protein
MTIIKPRLDPSEKNVERTVNSIAYNPSLLVSRARRLAINTKW